MIRVAAAIAWREVRLAVYRAAALHSIMQRIPWPPSIDGKPPQYRLTAEARAELAADVEAVAWAMLNAERGGAR